LNHLIKHPNQQQKPKLPLSFLFGHFLIHLNHQNSKFLIQNQFNCNLNQPKIHKSSTLICQQTRTPKPVRSPKHQILHSLCFFLRFLGNQRNTKSNGTNPPKSHSRKTSIQENQNAHNTKGKAYLLAPLGEDIEAEHALLGLDDVLEEVNLPLGIGLRVSGSGGGGRPRLLLLHQLLERQEGVLGGPAHQSREFHRLLP
jgi:hypothetical protein